MTANHHVVLPSCISSTILPIWLVVIGVDVADAPVVVAAGAVVEVFGAVVVVIVLAGFVVVVVVVVVGALVADAKVFPVSIKELTVNDVNIFGSSI